ncbi:NADPH:quinone reductase [Salinarimonas sp. NSM]|uniref:NADPH:quinone reductase n=1 Tax=Salinarimonas sp. NSM TaxID=3458003 RepID=UPI00403577B1
MRAVAYEASGPARDVLGLREVDDAPPGPGEVRIRVAFSGVNPTDAKVRGGAPGRRMAFPLVVPHHDGAGTVVELGSGAGRFRVGDRVWVFGAQNGRAFGTAADFVTLPERNVIGLADGLSLAEGACLGVPPMTAHAAVLGAGSPEGGWVLVTGGAGNVGRYAIQIARHAGARVLATVSSSAKAEIAREAGAERCVDYRDPDAGAQIRAATGGGGVDLAVDVDTSANAGLLATALADGGRVVSYGSGGLDAVMPVRDLRRGNATIRFLNILTLSQPTLEAIAADLGRLCAEGALRHRIAATFTLEQTAAAHELVESGAAAGRVLVSLDHSDGRR